MSVTTTLPRLVGLLALIGTVRLLPQALGTPLPEALPWLLVLVLWMVASIALLRGHLPVAAPGAIALLAVLAMPTLPPQDAPDLALLAWVCLLIAVTHHRPRERALLLRVCVTCVYAFTALAKLNPSFLAGEQIAWLAGARQQLGPVQDLLTSRAGVILAFATVVVEAWLATGLWFRRTRRQTAFLGAAFHVVLPFAAADSVFGLTLLVVLNGLLVACYLAFFDPDPLGESWGRLPEQEPGLGTR